VVPLEVLGEHAVDVPDDQVGIADAARPKRRGRIA
jgi:hypothetical protein